MLSIRFYLNLKSNEICQRTFNNIGGKEVFKYKSTSSIRLIPVLDYIESKSALNFTYNCSNIETRVHYLLL